MTQKPGIAVFDFDDTLIMRDTLPDFARFASSPLRFLLNALLLTPTVLKLKLRRVSNQDAKERLVTLFLRGYDAAQFAALCERYAARLDDMANPAALKRADWHRKRGDQTAIVSASAEDWIKPWAKRHDFDTVIATRLEKRDGKLTGKLQGKNCHGPEKVRRLLEIFPDRKSYLLYAYGDGKSDQQLFEIADYAYEKRLA